MELAPKLNPPLRTLLGPGPSPVNPRVLQSLSLPVIGHLDPAFLKIMDESMAMLRALFQTKNRLALPMSGTGSAGMETCFVNLIEPGDAVLIGVNGVFGTRMVDVAQRCGAQVDTVEAEWGTALDAAQFRAALSKKSFKLVAIVHAETSTGVLQPLEETSRLVHEHGSLLVVDAVTSLGGAPVRVDELGIDACYSGTQKCLSCPPGLAPITFGPRANLQDGCIVHTDTDCPQDIEEGVVVGHAAVLHGRRIGRDTLIAMGAKLLSGCDIGPECIVAAGIGYFVASSA
jgi:alanine-glyoxylate transaminase/serine-glyoxylate transaminase/serine-pyruvate transaminase